ncbi:hypothetical protein H5410_010581 [Solanum commersonii]|uniref:Aldehyde dehydrogenase domain-containing protein n=1 Tax=Solanum commersonii TaxID=4109 RepID=A0A9J6AM63_SOLCO|nr:hypothetical protein H5410_010581 [Solanum commersonii]
MSVNLKAVLYKHKKTGAEVMSVSNDDENKGFGVVFRLVICGVHKYKSSFFEQFLLSSSLIRKDSGASTACVFSLGSTDVSWMILWVFPVAISCGNTFILNPSEKAPSNWLFWDIVSAICDDDDIEVVSFVGSDAPSYSSPLDCIHLLYDLHLLHHVHNIFLIFSQFKAQLYMCGRPFANNSKGAKANMGTKNYAVVMPCTNVEATLNALVALVLVLQGNGAQQLALVFVGGSKSREDKLAERTNVKERISKLIQAIVDSGAKLILDGRQVAVSKYELGNFIGPTILSDIKEDIECSKEELLGPVLLCMQVCPMFLRKYCYGTSICTGFGALARKFQIEIKTRQVCINAAAPK